MPTAPDLRIRLVYTDDKSNKFWEVRVEGSRQIVCYGKVGTEGRTSETPFSHEAFAVADAQKKADAKRKKGYVDADGSEPPAQPAKPTNAKKEGPAKVAKQAQPRRLPGRAVLRRPPPWGEGGRDLR